MARPIRIELAGGLYHVTSRGDRCEAVFADDADRLLWLGVFGETCQRFNWVCHAWCLMGNHYHILIETNEPNLSQGMRHLNGVFTQSTNRRHRRVGHLFQGRFKSILVEKDSHLLELSRYVVLNPVRAGMVDNVDQWPWSSWHAMIGQKPAPPWLRTDWLLAQFGRTRKSAVLAYTAFVQAGRRAPSPWGALRGQVFLGSDTFAKTAQHAAAKDQITEIPRAQRRPFPLPLSDYEALNRSPEAAMAAAYASGGYTMAQIAAYFGVHYSSVSRAVTAKNKAPPR